MNRNKNRFLSIVFSCFLGMFVVNNAFASGNCSSSCNSSNLYNYTDCYYNSYTNKCRKCPSSSEASYWKQRSADVFGGSMYSANPSYGKCGYSNASNTPRFECGYMPATNSSCNDSNYRRYYYNSGSDLVCSKCEDGLSGRYPIYYESGDWYSQSGGTAIKYCHQCPSDLDASGVKSCGYDGFTCKDNYTKTLTSLPDTAMGSYCYKDGYQCVCEDDGNHYVGYNSVYCGSCSGESDNYDRQSCGYNTYTCKTHAYKIAYKTKPSGTWMQYYYGKYQCARCPYINNSSAFGISGSSDPYYMSMNGWTWSSTSRCTATQSSYQYDSNNCRYKWKNITPVSSCAGVTEGSGAGTDVPYSTESLPNATNMLLSTGCDYTGQKSYDQVPAGYGVTSNNTINATCSACTGNKWNDGTYTACQDLPAHATVKSDHTGYVCAAGYFAKDGDCVRCPMNLDFELAYSDWDYGTTSDAGATSVSQCYVTGSEANGSDDGTGFKYTGGMCPYNQSNFNGYYLLCFTIASNQQEDNCYQCLVSFAEHVVGVGTGYGQGQAWAEETLENAVPSNGTCWYNKHNGWYMGAGAMIEATDTNATWLKQFFANGTYACNVACNATTWAY